MVMDAVLNVSLSKRPLSGEGTGGVGAAGGQPDAIWIGDRSFRIAPFWPVGWLPP